MKDMNVYIYGGKNRYEAKFPIMGIENN